MYSKAMQITRNIWRTRDASVIGAGRYCGDTGLAWSLVYSVPTVFACFCGFIENDSDFTEIFSMFSAELVLPISLSRIALRR